MHLSKIYPNWGSDLMALKKRPGRGRPPKPDAANQTVAVQLSQKLLDQIDEWASLENIDYRSTAIRTLIERALLAAQRKPRKSRV